MKPACVDVGFAGAAYRRPGSINGVCADGAGTMTKRTSRWCLGGSVVALGMGAAMVGASGAGGPHASPQTPVAAQSAAVAAPAIPRVYANITATPDGDLVFQTEGQPALKQVVRPPAWTLAQAQGRPHGTATGIALDFGQPGLQRDTRLWLDPLPRHALSPAGLSHDDADHRRQSRDRHPGEHLGTV